MEMSRVKDGNYYVVQSFMVKELKLKGLELSCYAIIYGFSQAEGQVFNGSLQYLADWTCASKQAVMTALKKLVDKKLLIKTDKFVNGVKFVEYSATDFNTIQESCIGVSNKVEGGMQETLIPPVQETLPNNISNNKEDIKEDNKKIKIDKSAVAPNNLTKMLINNFYIEENEVFLAQYNFMLDELVEQYGFEIVKTCIVYFLQRWTGYDQNGKPILNKFGYLKMALENGAKRLQYLNSEDYETKMKEWDEIINNLSEGEEKEETEDPNWLPF